MAGRMIGGAAALAELVRPAGEVVESGMHRVLPVLPELGGLLPGRGLRRGSTVAIGLSSDSGSPHRPGHGWRRDADRRDLTRDTPWSLSGPRRTAPAPTPVSAGAGAGAAGGGGASAAAMTRAGMAAGPGVSAGAGVSVGAGSGNTSLLLALLAAASRAGAWCAVVGVPALGVLAAAESGIALERLALVPNPGPEWPTVVAALIDGVDVVVVAVPGPVSASVASRLVARARQRGCVLVPYGRWDGADVTLQVTRGRWEGVGAGRGRLRRREVTVVARGRGAAARPKEMTMWMPGIAATPAPVSPASRPSASGPSGPGKTVSGSGKAVSWPVGDDSSSAGEGVPPAGEGVPPAGGRMSIVESV
ncbi:hypothetical protein EDD30_2015 [Couchioplanes caeruleus]|uniref:Uncharacterized protein n=1 Tax=Couchioplanes caeruleus TaxID=56438 RepID=A0A3N1GG33_9ACTN|nr:hypothetical protein EDD30_2015 [Couchioplanes caeruleus]